MAEFEKGRYWPDFSKLSDPKTGMELIPAIVQDQQTRQNLMLGFMNEQAFEKTLETGKVVFWTRGRQRLWMKGETSGNFLEVKSLRLDCDNDTLLVEAKPNGPTCHIEGKWTCFD